jgi:hypothetical protein
VSGGRGHTDFRPLDICKFPPPLSTSPPPVPLIWANGIALLDVYANSLDSTLVGDLHGKRTFG